MTMLYPLSLLHQFGIYGISCIIDRKMTITWVQKAIRMPTVIPQGNTRSIIHLEFNKSLTSSLRLNIFLQSQEQSCGDFTNHKLLSLIKCDLTQAIFIEMKGITLDYQIILLHFFWLN